MKIAYEIETHEGIFSSELDLPDDHLLEEAEIEALKLEQLRLWLQTLPEHPTA